MKILLILPAVILSLTPTSATLADPIRIALPSWDSGKYVAYDLGHRIETELKRDISFVPIEGDPMWVELDKDNGSIDIFPDLWMPNQEHNWTKYVTNAHSVVSNTVPYKGRQGFYILNRNVDKSLEIGDLSKIEIISKLDTDGDGLAEYWPGAPGWHATIFSAVKLKSYDIDRYFKPLKQNNENFLDTLDARAKEGKPLVFYYWEPDWIHAKYSVQRLDEPVYIKGCRTIVDPTEDPDWLAKSTFGCAYPDSSVYVIFRDNLLIDELISAMLKNYIVDIKKMQAALLESKETGRDLRDIVSQTKFK